MNQSIKSQLLEQEYFSKLSQAVFRSLDRTLGLTLGYIAEDSQFVRISQSKIRQTGVVLQGSVHLELIRKDSDAFQKIVGSLDLTGNYDLDLDALNTLLSQLKHDILTIPKDPYAIWPLNQGTSAAGHPASRPHFEALAETLMPIIQGVDLAGLYSAGPSVAAVANSAGTFHWFSTDTFTFDYSLYNPNQTAVKNHYAGRDFSADYLTQTLEQDRALLAIMNQDRKVVKKGAYRTYLAPDSVSNLIGMLSWHGLSEASIQQGSSGFRKMRSGEVQLSPKFSIAEDFTQGFTSRFNSMGELSPEKISLIENGKLVSTLVSSRSAKEYGLKCNFADPAEYLRSPIVATGSLDPAKVAETIGEGLYLSNLHYLNWSDSQTARVTGMTRYAAFWVENGKIHTPIQDLRFDDSLFSLFGNALIDLTQTATVIPETGSYDYRAIGGMKVPGALVSQMQFTL